MTLTTYVFLRALRALSGRQCTDAPSRFRNPLALTRFAPLPRPTLLAGFLTLVSFQMALGAVERFEESFDGTGTYATISQNATGLDNPNWSLLSSEPGEFDGEGYVFEHKSLPANGFGWRRNVVGNGSFRQSLKLSQLDMGWTLEFPVPPIESEFAAFNLQGVRAQGSLSIIYDPVRLYSDKMLDWGFSTTTGGAIHIAVPLSTDVEMGIEQDFERKVAWAWIDSPVTGRIVKGPLAFTPYEDNPSIIDVRANGAATGSASYISGRLDNWSLEPLPDIRADINDDGELDVTDVDLLSLILRRNNTDAVADLSIDGKVDQTDLSLWIHDHRKSYFGDANLDGQFDSQDLTLVFQAGEYEDLIEDNSGWADGDWNADAEFTSRDLVVAFQDGGYETGPRPASTVPEPSGFVVLTILFAAYARLRAVRARDRLLSRAAVEHRNQHHQSPVLLTCFLVIHSCQMAFGAVEGFEESFDGTGNYLTTSGNLSGLDNPDWVLGTNAGIGTLDGNGYAFQVGVYPIDSDTLSRTIPGRGSFRESVRLSGLDMGWYSEGNNFEGGARSVVRLTHFVPTEPFTTELGVYFDEMLPLPNDNNAVQWFTGGATEIVPRFKDFEIGIEYQQGASVDYVWSWLDSSETGRVIRGPIEVKKTNIDHLFDYTMTYLILGKTMDGKMSGRLENWSVEPLPDIRADINDDGVLNVADVDLLSLIIQRSGTDAVADLSIDGKVDQTDLGLWIHDHRKSYFGDATLDGQFDSQDLTLVFQAGEYEDLVDDNSSWGEGDWNADGEFSSSDLVVAFQDGGYEKGPRPAVTTSVPEPSGIWLWLVGLAIAARHSLGSRTSRIRAQELALSRRQLACCLDLGL